MSWSNQRRLAWILVMLLAVLSGCSFGPVRADPVLPWDRAETAAPSAEPEETAEPSQTNDPESAESREPDRTEPPELAALRQILMDRAQALADSYRYDEALTLLQNAGPLGGEAVNALAQEISLQNDAMVVYQGPVYHVFFHSLIVDTSKAFDGGVSSEGYDLWMTTRDEFTAMLPQLEARGFVLVDYADLIQVAEDGTVTPAALRLPPGKKPLILSQDDVCYYDYMAGDGFAQRLDLDKTGRVTAIVDGQPTRDGDLVPILDDYVEAHPGFSYRGAKGILAVTGYEGIFGYRITDLQGQELADAQARAKAVCDRLKETGWRIASHSYTHNSYFQDGSVTMEQLQYDTGRWRRDIEPVTGPTNLYVTPFGMHLRADDPRFTYLVQQGYQVFCPVGADMAMTWNGTSLTQNRYNLDGFNMRSRTQEINELFFDVATVYDSTRPAH